MSEHADNHEDTPEDVEQEIHIAEPGDACPNCGEPLRGEWCYHCGQSQRSIHRFFLTLVGEALEDVFSWNSRTGRTFFALLFRPGFLATEFFAGRRARYLPPVRVYLITSFVFFFLLSIQNIVDGPTVRIAPTTTGTEIQPPTPPGETQSGAVGDAGTDDWRDELRDAKVHIDLPWLSESRNRKLRERMEGQLDKLSRIAKEDPAAIADAAIEVVPPAMFLLLPLFALLLKTFYFSFGFYYVEHLVLAVNNHSFLFTALIVEALLGMLPDWIYGKGFLESAILIWIPVYMYLSLKAVYRQGHFATSINFVLLGICYSLLLTFATVLALLVGLLAL